MLRDVRNMASSVKRQKSFLTEAGKGDVSYEYDTIGTGCEEGFVEESLTECFLALFSAGTAAHVQPCLGHSLRKKQRKLGWFEVGNRKSGLMRCRIGRTLGVSIKPSRNGSSPTS